MVVVNNFKKDTRIEDFYAEIEIENLTLKPVKEAYDIWAMFLELSKQGKLPDGYIEQQEKIITDFLKLKDLWGPQAFCLFDRDTETVICRHPDGKTKRFNASNLSQKAKEGNFYDNQKK